MGVSGGCCWRALAGKVNVGGAWRLQCRTHAGCTARPGSAVPGLHRGAAASAAPAAATASLCTQTVHLLFWRLHYAHSDGRMSSAMEPSTTMKCLRPLDFTPAGT